MVSAHEDTRGKNSLERSSLEGQLLKITPGCDRVDESVAGVAHPKSEVVAVRQARGVCSWARRKTRLK
jgi:hypothetical protein